MACIINASTSAGLVQSADTSGELQLQNNGTTVATINSTGLVASNTAKAWVNFAGATGTVTQSYNVSSVTRASTGNYTVNFTNAFSDSGYVTLITCQGVAGTSGFGGLSVTNTRTTTSHNFSTQGQNGATTAAYDSTVVNCMYLR
jgi:hypothetical protein